MVPNTALQTLRDLELPGPDLDLVVSGDELVVTTHAVQRYRERVERVPRWLATLRIRGLAATAAWRLRPARWMQVVIHPEVIYGYGSARPDVCVLVRHGAVVTVLSRRFLAEVGSLATGAIPVQRTVRNRPR